MVLLGILSAMPAEARSLCESSRPTPIELGEAREIGSERLLLVSGMGSVRAERGAQKLISKGVRALLSWGIAGGLDPRLRAGDLLIPEIIVDSSGRRFEADPRWRRALHEGLALGEGRQQATPGAALVLVQSERVVRTRAAKRELHRSSGACGVDMESATVAAAAQAAGVPFVALRAVCDTAATTLPRAALAATDEEGRMRWGRLAAALLRRPWDLTRLVGLRSECCAALEALRRASERAGPRLLLPQIR